MRFSTCAGTTKKKATSASTITTASKVRMRFAGLFISLFDSLIRAFGDDAVDVSVAGGAQAVKLVGDGFVCRAQRFNVNVGKLDEAHVGERLLNALAPQADVADGRHDAREQPLGIFGHEGRAAHEVHALIGIEA